MEVTHIRLWPPTGDCCICGEETELGWAVGYFCGPTHDEIGTPSTEYLPGDDGDNIVGGMAVCKQCHHDFHGWSPEFSLVHPSRMAA